MSKAQCLNKKLHACMSTIVLLFILLNLCGAYTFSAPARVVVRNVAGVNLRTNNSLLQNSSMRDAEIEKEGLFRSVRVALRTATGFSLTATRTACRTLTGVSISAVFAKVLSIFPLFFRFFLQPLLILYYTPIVLLKAFVGPSKEYVNERRNAHEVLVKGWTQAVQAAEKASENGYWPVTVDDEGYMKLNSPPDPENIVDLNEAIVQSVNVANGMN